MAAIFKWITARDDEPPPPPPSPSSSQPSRSASLSGGRQVNALVRRGDTSSHTIARSAKGPNSVTYASKDEKRNATFVCHLPAGSEHAMQAQKIAAAMYSGRPGGETSTQGDRRLGSGGTSLFLEDENGQARRERAAGSERLSTGGGGGGVANRSFFRRGSGRRAPTVTEQYADSSDDEGPESVPTVSRRSTLSSTSTRYYTSDDGHTVVEVEPSEFGGEREDHFDLRDSLSSAPGRYSSAASASVQAASLAMNPTRGGGAGSNSAISRTLSTIGRKSSSQSSGFRHHSDTHTTYNIKDRQAGRQLFVSAPIGSREAALHDQVVMQAASSGSRAAWIEDNSGGRTGAVSRTKWVGD